ncbi:MAG: hypothetical protein MUE77_02740 [Sandarakinorhabdus sp.]|jgi:hypothetical protein|nr:hypothetical protein [Sandarakinorhabdus sp.]
MKHLSIILAGGAAIALTACSSPAEQSAPAPAAVAAAAEPSGTNVPKPAPTDNLMKISCADFLETAKVAVDTGNAQAAAAAQDELANDLTWLHGYLFATRKGDIAVLSQDWMKATVARVHARCSAARDAAATSLFEVATS